MAAPGERDGTDGLRRDLQVMEQVALQPAQAVRVDLADEAFRVIGNGPHVRVGLFLPEVRLKYCLSKQVFYR